MEADKPVTIEEWRAHEAELRQRAADLDTEYAGRQMPEDATAEWDSINDEIEASRATIAQLEARAARLAELAGREDHQERIGDGLQVKRAGRYQGDTYDLAEYRRQSRSEDHQRELMVDGAKRAIEDIGKANPAADLDKAEGLLRGAPSRDPEDVARHLLRYGSPAYSSAFGKTIAGRALNPEEQRAFTVGSTGTYPVPIALDPTVVHTSNWSINPWRQISNVETITGTTWKGVTSGAITAARANEAAAASDNTPTLTQPSITPTRVQAFVPFSYETDQDWSGLQVEMARLFAEAKDDEEATAFATGNGSGANPQGILSSSAAVTTVTTASAGAFVVGDVYKLLEQLPPRFRPNATWVTNLFLINKIRQLDTAGGANLVVRLPFGASGQPGSQQASSGVELLGRPLYESTAINTSNVLTTGTNVAVLGDFRYYKIVERLGLEVRLVPDVFDTSTGYPTGQSGMYAFWRNSGKVLSASAFRILQT
jgi:HK97 family phage major capsid protein